MFLLRKLFLRVFMQKSFTERHKKVFAFIEKHFLSSENSTKPSLEGNHDRKKKKKCLGIEVQGPKNLKLKCCGGVP